MAANGTIYQTDSTDNRLRSMGIAGYVPSAAQFDRITVVSGLNTPVDFRFLPGGRMLIAEKGGAIKVASSNGQVQSAPLITLATDSGASRGIEGIELDPHFDQNGFVYVSYVMPNKLQRVSRLTVTNPTGSVLTIDPASELVLVQGNQTAADDHLGGELRFGADGKLYIAIGDNGYFNGSTAISGNAQDLSNIYGKVLRINSDGSVPSDNPFVNTPGALPSIYAFGLRNPFRGSLTPDGKLLVGDVGQSDWEEIDLITAGANYGWPSAEGVCPGPGVCTVPGVFVNPAYAYAHNGSSSISSVLVYDGSAFGPDWKNTVFFADFSQKWIKTVTCNAGFSSCGNEQLFMAGVGGTTRLLVGPDGNIYQLTLDGKVSRIAPTGSVQSAV